MKRHTIDVLFSLSLFMVFVICSFLLLLFQINGYHHISEDQDHLTTTASYIQTTIRRFDAEDAITIKQIDGTMCLCLYQDEEAMYLYVQDGMLKELYQKKAMDIDLDFGDDRFALRNWEIKQEGNRLSIKLNDETDALTFTIACKGGVLV